MAFFGWRGDRKLTAAGAKYDHIYAPLNSERVHQHEKPVPVLQHFFEMVVDEHTRMLDPTCGSGTSVRVAQTLGAASALGIERDPIFASDAQRLLARTVKPTLEELGL